MKKIISSREVRVGDVIRVRLNSTPAVVDEVWAEPHIDSVTFWVRRPRGQKRYQHAHEGDRRLILVHRPWPDDKTEADMLEAVEVALRRCAHAQIENDGRSIGAYLELWRSTNLGENLRMLREALEAYELGKPLEVKP